MRVTSLRVSIGGIALLVLQAACTRTAAPADGAPVAPSPPATSTAARPASAPAADAHAAPVTDAEEMARIRDASARSPGEALALIERADALHPGDAGGEERAWRKVDALVGMQQIGRARVAAEDFLRRYPHSAQAERIRALTGVHPRPLGPRE